MGVLCDVYIAADRKRALKYNFRGECTCKNWRSCKCWDEYAPRTYECIESRRIYVDNFAQLLSILRGKSHQAVIEEFQMIKEFSDQGPWIQKVPDDLPKLLAAATAEELKSITKSWVELMNAMYRLPVPIKNSLILDYLKLLQKLCKESVKKRQSMYLWTSL